MDKNIDSQIYSELAGQLWYEDGRLSQIKMLHTRILKLNATRNHYSSAEIGRVLSESGQFQKSITQLKRALIIDPVNDYVQIDLAKALLKLERENEAFSYLRRAFCIFPGSPIAHEIVTKRFQEQRKLGDLESFYQGIAESLTDAKSIADLYFRSAESLTAFSEYSSAFKMYPKAFEAYQMKSDHYFQYAIALCHEGLFEEAAVQFEHVMELSSTNKFTINNMAYIQYCAGMLQKSFENFEEILANGLETAGTYSNFILVLYHLDKEEEVINRYRDLLLQNLGENGPMLRSMYEEALRITRVVLARDNIDEATREFNLKKIQGLNLVLSFIN